MQAAYGEKYDLMMFDSKRDVTNLLREVMETHSAREFLCRKEKDAGTAAEKTDIMNRIGKSPFPFSFYEFNGKRKGE